MLKKWKKTLKVLATIFVLLIYVTKTIELYGSENLKSESSKRDLNIETEFSTASDRYSGTIKTIVGYSREFRVRKELQDQIECEQVGDRPDSKTSNATSSWKHDRKLGIRAFSAYYDQRQEPYRYVRIIGLIPRNLSLYCQIWYENNETMIHVTQKAVVQEIWLPSWRTKGKNCEKEYPAIISCLASPPNGSDSSTPSWVSFVDKNCVGSGTFVRIVSPPRKSPKNNFVVCVKPLHFTNVNEKTFHEWVEINHRLGAERIVVYLSDSTKTKSFSIRGKKAFVLADKRFEAPESKCPIKNFEDSVWYRRKLEIIAYNDCFYSNLRRTKFVVPLDVDEIIVPKTGNNWLEGFRSHFLNVTSPGQNENFWPENYASFSVRNAYFFSKYPKNAIVGGSELPKPYQNVPQKLVKTFPGIRKPSSKSKSIFDRTVRSFRLSPKSDSVKSFVSASKTLSVFNHFTFHVLGNAAQQYIFPQNAFQLNHYRNSCDPILIDGCQDFLNHVIYDDSLERFRNRKGKF